MELDIQRFADGKVVIQTELDTKNFKNGLDRMQNTAKGAGTSIKSIVAGLGITKLISMGFNAIRNSMDDAITRMDTLNNFPKVMSNLGVSAEDSEQAIKKMSDKLAGLPTTLDQGASAVQRFTSKNGDVKKSTNIFLALNNAILAGGAPTEMQATALEQLSQAYAKGKPDMMEWRSAMSAMPAQLKQVAVAMGYVNADELGEALRTGKVSMDEFMEKITELNTKGANGFKSFEEQARNSTGGIKTSITVAKTQIVKGVADMIEGLNKGLKKAKLGSISQIIANIGKSFKKELDKVANMLSKIDFKAVIKAFKTLAPAIMGVVSALVAYRVAVLTTKAINFAKDIMAATKVFLGLVPAIKSATVSQNALNMAQSASPVGIILATVGALVAMVAAYKALHPETNKNVLATKKLKEEYKTFNEEMKASNDQRKQNVEDVLVETKNAEVLASKIEELSKVENKNVYEKQEMKRLVAELNELMPGLNLQYNEEADKLNMSTQAIRDNIKAQKELNLVKAYQKNLKIIAEDIAKAEVKRAEAVSKNRKNMEDYQKAKNKFDAFNAKHSADEITMSGKLRKKAQELNKEYLKTKEALSGSKKVVADYDAQLDKLNKKYDTTAQSAENFQNKADMKKLIAQAEEAGIKVPESLKNQIEKGFYAIPQSLDQLQNLIKFDKAINNAAMSGQKIPQSISQNLMTGKITVEQAMEQVRRWLSFQAALQDAGLSGRKIPEKIKQGILSGKTTPNQAIKEMTGNMKKKFDKGGKESGEDLLKGVEKGSSGRKKKTNSFLFGIAGEILAAFKGGLKEHSPSKATYQMALFLFDGFDIGAEKGSKKTIKNVGEYATDIVDAFEDATDMTSTINKMQKQMQSAVNLQQGKMNTNVQTGKVFNSLVATTPVNIDLDASIEMDKQKVGRMVTPEVSRTIKTGGGV